MTQFKFKAFLLLAIMTGGSATACASTRMSGDGYSSFGESAPVATRAAYREQIRATPILERPNRIGHFYGNTVRRLNGPGPQRFAP